MQKFQISELGIKPEESVYLIKHPLEANYSRTLIRGSTTEAVRIVNFIQRLHNIRNIFPPIINIEYLTV